MHKLKSELHITDIDREDKGRWVAAARDSTHKTLAEWVIDALNRAEHEQTLSKKRLESGYYDRL